MISKKMVLARVKHLPTLSNTVARLSQVLRDSKSGAAEFEAVVRPDPALTANLLKLANSAYFGRSREVSSVREAIQLLGTKRLFEVAAGAAFSGVIPKKIPGYEIDAAEYWLHNITVAIWAEQLAAASKSKAPDLLFTAGLLHDIGKLVIGSFLTAGAVEIKERMADKALPFIAAERELLGTDHAEIGETIAHEWHLPEAIAWVARWHHTPMQTPDGVDRTLVSLVHVADGLAHAMGLGADIGELMRRLDTEVLAALKLKPRQLERVIGSTIDTIRETAEQYGNPAGGRT